MEVLVRHLRDVLDVDHEADEFLLLQAELPEDLEFMLENLLGRNVLAPGMPTGEHNEPAVKHLASVGTEFQTGWDALRVLGVVLNTTVREVDFLH